MAAREDANPESSILAGKEKVHETTSLIAGEVRLPESGFERQRTHKTINHDKPAVCSKSNCKLRASHRALMYDSGNKDYCSQHWDKIEPNTDTYDPDSVMVLRPEHGEEVRGENRVARQLSRAQASADIVALGGAYYPVRGPGNPREAVDPDSVEDHISPVIDRAVVHGGRNLPAVTPVNAAALLHKLKVGGAPKTQDQELSEINKEIEVNPTTKAPNSFDEYEGLMGRD